MLLFINTQISTAIVGVRVSMSNYSPHKIMDVIQALIPVNTLRPRQNGHHFPDDIFQCIFLNENVWISIKISLNFVPKGPINNISALVQIMAWRRAGDKPLSEPMMVSLLTHTWVKACCEKGSHVEIHHLGVPLFIMAASAQTNISYSCYIALIKMQIVVRPGNRNSKTTLM